MFPYYYIHIVDAIIHRMNVPYFNLKKITSVILFVSFYLIYFSNEY